MNTVSTARARTAPDVPSAVLVLLWCLGAFFVNGLLLFAGVVLPRTAELFLALGLPVLVLGSLRHRGLRTATFSTLAALLFAALLTAWPLGDRKAFVRDVRRIQPGMTRTEVAAVLHDYTEGHPWGADFLRIWGGTRGQYWHHNAPSETSFDHCVVTYDAEGLVARVELFLD